MSRSGARADPGHIGQAEEIGRSHMPGKGSCRALGSQREERVVSLSKRISKGIVSQFSHAKAPRSPREE